MLRQARSPPMNGSRLESTQSMPGARQKSSTLPCLWRLFTERARSSKGSPLDPNRFSRRAALGQGVCDLSAPAAASAPGGPFVLSGHWACLGVVPPPLGGLRTALTTLLCQTAGGWEGGGAAALCGPFRNRWTGTLRVAPTRTQSINQSIDKSLRSGCFGGGRHGGGRDCGLRSGRRSGVRRGPSHWWLSPQSRNLRGGVVPAVSARWFPPYSP